MTLIDPPRNTAELTVEQALQQAVNYHQAGRLAEAERLYRAILQSQPNHPDANHNLGVLAVQVKNPNAGLPHFKIALEANPDLVQYWLSYIDALIQAGRAEDACYVLEQGQKRGLHGDAVGALSMRIKQGTQLPAQENVQPALEKTTRREITAGRGGGPRSQEINEFAILFNTERYAEAETLARTIAEHFPGHGIGWKGLGVVLQRMGKHLDALAPLGKAAALLSNDAEAHFNLGISLQHLGHLNDAETSYRRALQVKTNFVEAYSNLGILLKELKREEEAEAIFRQALKLNPNSVETITNLGLILYERSKLKEAEAHFLRAIGIQSTYAKAHSNLSLVMSQRGSLDEAEASCLRAIELDPYYAEAHNILGAILVKRGRLNEAKVSYHQAIQLKPDFAEAHFNLGHVFCDLDDWAGAVAEYQNTFDSAPTDIGLDAVVYLAVLDYLRGNIEKTKNDLLASQQIMVKVDTKHKNAQHYWQYLDKLLRWQCSSTKIENQQQCVRDLHVIGESHSLSAHKAVVSYRSQEMHCTSEWISGCKQWHLGNDKVNKYKHKFEAVMARLPRVASVLLLFGEIDCRHDEGVLEVCIKHPGRSQTEIIQATVDGYVKYIATVAARYGHRLIVGGVPAPNVQLIPMHGSEAEQVVQVIREFNARLKDRSLDAGMDFLDLYALTNQGDGISAGQWHIDSHHLVPDAIVKAFDTFCLYH